MEKLLCHLNSNTGGMNRFSVTIFFFFFISINNANSQEFLHVEGKYLYDKNNNEIILRGLGTGNWLLQEGYYMQAADITPTMHEFRAKLIESIGEEKTDSFYNAWLTNHFTRTDADSMKSWGFNSVRVAMHYKWFTLPIEDEPIPGQNTWFESGFLLIDSLLSWCSANEMYLILDMHGTPGGQGNVADISDYDDTKDHLWENQQNKDKLVALWHKLAERYKDEPWIGGYDLINETNYTFTEGDNSPLRSMFETLTNSIREVDTNHVIYIEGNHFATDFSGLTPAWDNNMVYSFHTYWSANSIDKFDGMIALRDSQNVPIWLGESGENSNSWYAGMVSLLEQYHIGWSWWPVKKVGLNGSLGVVANDDYINLINYWKGQAPSPTIDEAFQAVLTYAENHKIENCIYRKDVVDALLRQPFTTETIPYKIFKCGEKVYTSDFDLGRVGHAYFDTDTANITGAQGPYTIWNQGNNYRNDGVDIGKCTDNESNGYYVGWTNDDEWMQYTIESDSIAAYTLNIRHASGSGGSVIRFEVDEIPVTGHISLPGTGDGQTWSTFQLPEVIFPAGNHKVKLIFVQGGSNINYFRFSDPQKFEMINFKNVYASTTENGYAVALTLNKKITSDINGISINDFIIISDNVEQVISGYSINPSDSNTLFIELSYPLYYGSVNNISYTGNTVFSGNQELDNFSGFFIENNLPVRYEVPCRIQAEDFYINNGFKLEECTDTDNGFNIAYADAGDYLDYLLSVQTSGFYNIIYRYATENTLSEIIIKTNQEGNFVNTDTVQFTSTQGWQDWDDKSSKLYLEAGKYTFRIYVEQSAFNLNWFEFEQTGISLIKTLSREKTSLYYPNPAHEYLIIQSPEGSYLEIYSMQGQLLHSEKLYGTQQTIPVDQLKPGNYIVRLVSKSEVSAEILIIE